MNFEKLSQIVLVFMRDSVSVKSWKFWFFNNKLISGLSEWIEVWNVVTKWDFTPLLSSYSSLTLICCWSSKAATVLQFQGKKQNYSQDPSACSKWGCIVLLNFNVIFKEIPVFNNVIANILSICTGHPHIVVKC